MVTSWHLEEQSLHRSGISGRGRETKNPREIIAKGDPPGGRPVSKRRQIVEFRCGWRFRSGSGFADRDTDDCPELVEAADPGVLVALFRFTQPVVYV